MSELPLATDDANAGDHAAPPVPPPVPMATNVADGVERSLDPRNITLQKLQGWIFTACVAAANTIALPIVILSAPLPALLDILIVAAALGVVVTLAWLGRTWPEVEHRHAFYRVGAEGIEIRQGVVWRHVISVPRSRIQHTDVSQGPLARRFGLGTLSLFTAGTEHERIDLSGLDHGVAMAIRDALAPSD